MTNIILNPYLVFINQYFSSPVVNIDHIIDDILPSMRGGDGIFYTMLSLID